LDHTPPDGHGRSDDLAANGQLIKLLNMTAAQRLRCSTCVLENEMNNHCFACFLVVLLVLSPNVAMGQRPSFTPPEDISLKKVTIMSEGTRMVGETFSLKTNAGKKLPTIIMCHGWGGTAAGLRRDAVVFARGGYFVVTFDYRGWGASDARVILVEPAPNDKEDGTFTAKVREVRGVVDPIDQTTDLLNAIHWVQGEPQCDTESIGLWGSSYSGGHVVYAAARDQRVKATVSQVAAFDSRWVVANDELREATYEKATGRARGDTGYPKPFAKELGNLNGAPIRERMINYAPVEDAGKAPHCAMLFVIAEKEELFDNADHGILAHERAKGPKKLVVVEGIQHYGIYREQRARAQQLALEWYDEHLKK
jgi:dienelactone hydrolase